MGSRKIFCWSTFTWARIVVWFQMIVHLLLGLGMIWVLMHLTDMKEKRGNDIKPTLIAAIALGLIMSLMGFGISVLLLLKGINQKNPAYSTAFIVFSLLYIVSAVLGGYIGGGPLYFVVIKCTIQIIIATFCMWIVYLLKNEILTENGRRPQLRI